MSKFTIVLQGPAHPNTAPAARSWGRYGHVIISTWEGSDVEELKKQVPWATFVVHNKFEVPASTYNRQNVYLQCITSLGGIDLADTEYVIKARSDTFIGNPEPFIVACMAFPDRYVCSNLHFRPDATFKFHASDKIIGGAAEEIRNTFQLSKERCERDGILLNSGIYDYTFNHKGCPYKYWQAGESVTKTSHEQVPIIGLPCELPFGYVGVYPEVLLSTSYLIQKGLEIDRAKSRQLMYENFWVVAIEECLPYSNKDGWPHPEHNWHEISHINQL